MQTIASKETQASHAKAAINAGLDTRGEWLSPRDLSEVFSVSRSTAWRMCRSMPHVYVGKRNIRVARRDVLATILGGEARDDSG